MCYKLNFGIQTFRLWIFVGFPFFFATALVSVIARGQDPHFSQFFANRVYLNPAYAGFDPGGAVTVNYREQWFGLSGGENRNFGSGFRTFNVTTDIQAPCFLRFDRANMGFSISAFRDEAGGAPLATHGLSLAMSHERALIASKGAGRLRRLDLRAGLQIQYGQQSLDANYLLYSDLLDPVIGLVSNPLTVRLRSNFYPLMNAGILLRGNYRRNKDRDALFTLGVQMANINEPLVSLFEPGTSGSIPQRITFHGGFTARVPSYKGTSGSLYLSPQFRWDRQLENRLNLQTIGTYLFSSGFFSGIFLQYNFRNEAPPPEIPIWGGFIQRNTTTLIFHTGIDLRSTFDNGKPWRKRETGTVLGFSYDFNLTGLNQQTTLGVFEVSLSTRFGKQQAKSCGELGQFELYKGKCPVRF
jgi:type IX secretion system PorP/SprF family membrane protein